MTTSNSGRFNPRISSLQSVQAIHPSPKTGDIKITNDIIVNIEFLTDRPCTLTDINDPIVLAAGWATRQVSEGEPEYAGVPGATDGTYLWTLKDIPIVTMGAGEREVAHQVDEWVDLEQLVETTKIYALAALHYLYPRDRL